ncbi:hypothetical protein GUJ93_ZPchr0008g13885 [Zizania palustris]|uniref:Uncharacterized protein n=1 Tax=Zizania palustris TaxID=103762 RepID=A0A8J5RWX8_ZIZPA|nr:hypothetical protein GUJ93_ZPchr0008g13885 [Zizania palustris]
MNFPKHMSWVLFYVPFIDHGLNVHHMISAITIADGTIATSPEDKAEVFLGAFLDRMGFPSNPCMHFQLQLLIPRCPNLDIHCQRLYN